MIRSVILVSGGMDSLVTAAIAKKESDEVFFLHLNYGQLTERKEKECFQKLVGFYQPKEVMLLDIPQFRSIGSSSLIDMNIPLDTQQTGIKVPNTYVPFRNGNFLAIAAGWAEVLAAGRIYIGAVEEDSSGYPDCRESFFRAFERSIHLGTKSETNIRIFTPVIHLKKAEIVKLGKRLAVPFQYSWSCYRDQDLACGTCDSCILRLKAFRDAGMQDPIPYRQKKP